MTEIIEFQIVNKKTILNVLTHTLKNPKNILIHLHGLHSTFQPTFDCPDEFNNRVNIFKKGNIVSYALEFNGHGKSDGKKGYINNFDNLIEDLNCLVSYVEKYHDNLPIYLLGESLGGSVAVKYNNLYPDKVKGIILLSPLFGFSNNINYCYKKFLLNLSYFLPSINLNLFLKKERGSVNKDYNRYLNKNKYNFTNKLTLCSIRESYLFCSWWNKNINSIKYPVLVFHSINDKITDYESSTEFYQLCNNSFSEFISYSGENHSLLVPRDDKDFNPYIILHKIANWIMKNKNWEKISLN